MQDGSKMLVELDGDEFAECDYGLVVDNSTGTQELNQKLDMLAQAGIQNGYSLSVITKLYSTTSTAEKTRIIELDEQKRQEQQQQQQQQQMQMQQEEINARLQAEREKMQMEYQMHKEDNETKILVAQINSRAEELRYAMIQEENGITKQQELEFKQKQLEQDSKQFDAKLKADIQKHKDDITIKEKQLRQKGGSK
jgi:multidrug efflux pump subunit AcrA (membrane-fusion protein)